MQRRGALMVAAVVSTMAAGLTVAGAAVGPVAVLGFGEPAAPAAELSLAVDATPTNEPGVPATAQTILQLRYVDTYVQLPAPTTTVGTATTATTATGPASPATTSGPVLAVQRARADLAATATPAAPPTATTPPITLRTAPPATAPVTAPPTTTPPVTHPSAPTTTRPRPVTTTEPGHDDDHDEREDDHEDEREEEWEEEREDDEIERPESWGDDRPIPPVPTGCRHPHLEDDGTWDCED